MVENFPKPRFPMGEAWFLGKRRMFTELVQQEWNRLPLDFIEECLEEIIIGVCFFNSPLVEWDDWYHYLLPRLIPSAFEQPFSYRSTRLVTSLISTFLALHPLQVRDSVGYCNPQYLEFRRDALSTLGQAIMAPALWENSEVVLGQMLYSPPPAEERAYWGWYRASGDFAASMFFCWKYLKPEEIDSWLASVFRIECSHWRTQLLVWLLGMAPVLNGEMKQVAELPKLHPPVIWETSDHFWNWSRRMEPAWLFLPEENRDALQKSLSRHLTPDLFLEWIESFARFPYLEEELGQFPDQFVEAFLKSSLKAPARSPNDKSEVIP